MPRTVTDAEMTPYMFVILIRSVEKTGLNGMSDSSEQDETGNKQTITEEKREGADEAARQRDNRTERQWKFGEGHVVQGGFWRVCDFCVALVKLIISTLISPSMHWVNIL